MKVLVVNGSAHTNGNTATALREMEKVFDQEGVEFERFDIGALDIRGCAGCGGCFGKGQCVFDNDIVNEFVRKLGDADGLVLGTPVFFASANGTLTSFLDRVFFSCNHDLRMKVGCAVAVARRGGITATFDQLNKYFTISGMPVASGQYWNGAHGAAPGEASQDLEGMQQMRTLARNMVFLMRSIELGKQQYGLPQTEERVGTNFIR